jgi:hypothetical protein
MALSLSFRTPQGDTLSGCYAKLTELAYTNPSATQNTALLVEYRSPQGKVVPNCFAKVMAVNYLNRDGLPPRLRLEVNFYREKASADLGDKPYNPRPTIYWVENFDPAAGDLTNQCLDYLIQHAAEFKEISHQVPDPADGIPLIEDPENPGQHIPDPTYVQRTLKVVDRAAATKVVDLTPTDGALNTDAPSALLVVGWFESQELADQGADPYMRHDYVLAPFDPRAPSMGAVCYGFLMEQPELAGATVA